MAELGSASWLVVSCPVDQRVCKPINLVKCFAQIEFVQLDPLPLLDPVVQLKPSCSDLDPVTLMDLAALTWIHVL